MKVLICEMPGAIKPQRLDSRLINLHPVSLGERNLDRGLSFCRLICAAWQALKDFLFAPLAHCELLVHSQRVITKKPLTYCMGRSGGRPGLSGVHRSLPGHSGKTMSINAIREQNSIFNSLFAGVDNSARSTARAIKARQKRAMRLKLLDWIAGRDKRQKVGTSWLTQAHAYLGLHGRERRKRGHWSYDPNLAIHYREQAAMCLWMAGYDGMVQRIPHMTEDEADRAMHRLERVIERAQRDGAEPGRLVPLRRLWLRIHERWASLAVENA